MEEKTLFDGGNRLPLIEEFYTIQGEGFHTGKAAYFLRLGGCDVGCRWCDAKESWNPALHPPVAVGEIVTRAAATPARAVVITGGEPTLYPLGYLTGLLHEHDIETFLETSGTHPLSGSFDWICLSPKKQKPPLEENLLRADELKVIVESADDLTWAELNAKRVAPSCRLYLQPEWSRRVRVAPLIVDYVKEHPRWNISIQSHKYLRIP